MLLNLQILDPLDFLAEFSQHIPAKGSQLNRYYGWYSEQVTRPAKALRVAKTMRPYLEALL